MDEGSVGLASWMLSFGVFADVMLTEKHRSG